MEHDDEPRGAITFRTREREMLALAEASSLDGQRLKYLRAAERWAQLAELAENPPKLPTRTP